MEKRNEKQDSIVIKPLAKGGYTWEIKLYFDDDPDKKAEDVIKRLKEIDNKLRGDFNE